MNERGMGQSLKDNKQLSKKLSKPNSNKILCLNIAQNIFSNSNLNNKLCSLFLT